jgi:hypothetical protein
MAKRYNGDNKALDLSKFYADPDFVEANMFVPLDRSNVMTSVSNPPNSSVGPKLPISPSFLYYYFYFL